MKNIKDSDIVIFDVETTGLSPIAGDRIVELAAYKLKNLEVVDTFDSLINPERPVSPGAYMVNKISDEMVAQAPLMEDVLEDFLKFIQCDIIIGHNIRFDLTFLNHEMKLAGYEPIEEIQALDTVKMSRGLLPNIPSYTLSSVALALDVREAQQHRALADVEMTYQVFCKLFEIAKERELSEPEVMFDLFGFSKSKRPTRRVIIEKIDEAIANSVSLRMLYSGVSSGATRRVVTPQRIQGEGRQKVLVGFCHLRGEERLFKLSNIIHLETNA